VCCDSFPLTLPSPNPNKFVNGGVVFGALHNCTVTKRICIDGSFDKNGKRTRLIILARIQIVESVLRMAVLWVGCS
jgi:hypothetical protein